MNEGMTSQKNQREYLKHLKNSGIAIGTVFVTTIVIVGLIDYLLL
jgi:hypothetical protein